MKTRNIDTIIQNGKIVFSAESNSSSIVVIYKNLIGREKDLSTKEGRKAHNDYVQMMIRDTGVVLGSIEHWYNGQQTAVGVVRLYDR